jgi:uncharacterized membrane protein YphA (DoxX/SURF4 family)
VDVASLLPVAQVAGRLTLGAVFLIAGWAKLRAGPDRFHTALMGYDLLPRRLLPLVARWLPRLEIATAILLFAGVSAFGAIAAAGLLAVFSVAVALALARGKRSDCGCFGRAVRPLQRTIVARNLGLLFIAALLLLPVAH